MKAITKFVCFGFASLALACFTVSPTARAVVPAPDGGYPGFNTAEGQGALLHLGGGTYNTALGWSSLGFNITGNLNTGIGAATLLSNIADNNTATGAGALLSNTTGTDNTANGVFALFSNTEGNSNTAFGANALFSNTQGGPNTAVGVNALMHNTDGIDNTAIGFNALWSNTSGTHNTAVGVAALYNNRSADNTAIGDGALFLCNGGNNVAIGFDAGDGLTTGSNNIALGINAGSGVTTASNVICIGTDGNNVDNACYIGQIFGATSLNGTAVFINSNGRLGTMTSSARFKDEIKPMDKASEALFSLKPVRFRYKREIDPAGTSQLGLVAEDVARVNHDLVVCDKDGRPYTVRYDQVNAMLLNEFLKEHKTFIEEQRKVEELEKAVATLTAGLQKVSAQLEVSKPATQTVLNNP